MPNHPHGDRDASIDALLRQTLRDGAARVDAGPCVDADLLAAWSDRSVTDAEALLVETHIAGCARCQAIAASLARVSSPLAELRPSFWRRWQVGWLVPVAAAAALAVWVALPDRRTEPVLESFQSRIDPPVEPPEPTDRPAALNEAPAATPVPPQRTDREAESRKPAPAAPALADGPRERRAGATGTGSAAKTAADGSSNDTAGFAPVPEAGGRADAAADRAPERREEPAAARQERQTPAAPPAPAPSPAAAPVAPPVVPAQPAPAAPPRAPEESTTARATAPGGGLQGASRLARASANDESLVVAAPGSQQRWRVVARRRLERSLDAGASWVRIVFQPRADLTAGASPGGNVCWFVGRAGAVAVTTDGSTFTRPGVPTTADLVAVRPEDARTAVVATADGTSFRTTDGGATWQPVAR